MAKVRDREGDVMGQVYITDAQGNPVWQGADLQEDSGAMPEVIEAEDDEEELSLEDFKRAFENPDNIEIQDLGTAG